MSVTTSAGRSSWARAGWAGTRLRSFLGTYPVWYLAPTLLLLAAFGVYPLVVLFQMAFSNVGPANVVGTWHFVGWANFVAVLTSSEVWAAFVRTLAVSAALLISNLVGGFIVASILSVPSRVTSTVLAIMVFIWALPPLVSGSAWKFLLDSSGPVDAVFGLFTKDQPQWLSAPGLALWSVTAVIAWAALPFSTLILRGSMLAVSQDVIEAAAIDGARYWRTQLAIVMPMVRPTLWILSVFTLLYAFKSFDFFYILTQGGPGTATNTLPVLSYYAAFSNFDMSTGATVAASSLLVVALLSIPYIRGVRREETE